MTLILAGLALWYAVHMVPSLGSGLKQSLVERWGLVAYRVVFAALVLTAMLLMVLGWRSAQPVTIYLPEPAWRPAGMALAVLGLVTLSATRRASRIGRLVRYPQLAGMLIWACGHLLANGDSRSLLLFGGFAVWAVLEMILISRREGPWIKPEVPGWGTELLYLGLALCGIGVVVYIHPWISGMPLV